MDNTISTLVKLNPWEMAAFNCLKSEVIRLRQSPVTDKVVFEMFICRLRREGLILDTLNQLTAEVADERQAAETLALAEEAEQELTEDKPVYDPSRFIGEY